MVKKSISFVGDEIFFEGKNLRQVPLDLNLFSEEVNIYNGEKIISDIDEFNEKFKEFQERQSKNAMIEKIICEARENKIQITIKKRLPKIHNYYDLTFFLAEYSFYAQIESKKKEINEIKNNPSLPLEEGGFTVDENKILELEKQVKQIEKELEQDRKEYPDLDLRLGVRKSEYKTNSTVITFVATPDDVYDILERKIETLNNKFGLFLIPSVS